MAKTFNKLNLSNKKDHNLADINAPLVAMGGKLKETPFYQDCVSGKITEPAQLNKCAQLCLLNAPQIKSILHEKRIQFVFHSTRPLDKYGHDAEMYFIYGIVQSISWSLLAGQTELSFPDNLCGKGDDFYPTIKKEVIALYSAILTAAKQTDDNIVLFKMRIIIELERELKRRHVQQGGPQLQFDELLKTKRLSSILSAHREAQGDAASDEAQKMDWYRRAIAVSPDKTVASRQLQKSRRHDHHGIESEDIACRLAFYKKHADEIDTAAANDYLKIIDKDETEDKRYAKAAIKEIRALSGRSADIATTYIPYLDGYEKQYLNKNPDYPAAISAYLKSSGTRAALELHHIYWYGMGVLKNEAHAIDKLMHALKPKNNSQWMFSSDEALQFQINTVINEATTITPTQWMELANRLLALAFWETLETCLTVWTDSVSSPDYSKMSHFHEELAQHFSRDDKNKSLLHIEKACQYANNDIYRFFNEYQRKKQPTDQGHLDSAIEYYQRVLTLTRDVNETTTQSYEEWIDLTTRAHKHKYWEQLEVCLAKYSDPVNRTDIVKMRRYYYDLAQHFLPRDNNKAQHYMEKACQFGNKDAYHYFAQHVQDQQNLQKTVEYYTETLNLARQANDKSVFEECYEHLTILLGTPPTNVQPLPNYDDLGKLYLRSLTNQPSQKILSFHKPTTPLTPLIEEVETQPIAARLVLIAVLLSDKARLSPDVKPTLLDEHTQNICDQTISHEAMLEMALELVGHIGSGAIEKVFASLAEKAAQNTTYGSQCVVFNLIAFLHSSDCQDNSSYLTNARKAECQVNTLVCESISENVLGFYKKRINDIPGNKSVDEQPHQKIDEISIPTPVVTLASIVKQWCGLQSQYHFTPAQTRALIRASGISEQVTVKDVGVNPETPPSYPESTVSELTLFANNTHNANMTTNRHPNINEYHQYPPHPPTTPPSAPPLAESKITLPGNKSIKEVKAQLAFHDGNLREREKDKRRTQPNQPRKTVADSFDITARTGRRRTFSF